MTDRSTPRVSSRKLPQQARSADLVAAILQAAVRVLEKEGATRFTTARVAETAGVSIGSLYQYFPNKAAILFRLQCDEWRQTTELMRRILQNDAQSSLDRLRELVHGYIHSECQEAGVRAALSDTAPLYRNAPEAKEASAAGKKVFNDFIFQALPASPLEKQQRVADLIARSLSSVGKEFSDKSRSEAEITLFADEMADMFCAYLKHAGHP